MPEKPNGKLSTRQTFLIAILSAVLGSTGGNYLLSRVFPDAIRPDPFTGEQGRALELRIERVEGHVEDHPDVALRAAISELRAEQAAAKAERGLMLRNQDRMIERLDHLTDD